jgi:hypothetical protein
LDKRALKNAPKQTGKWPFFNLVPALGIAYYGARSAPA